jgi:hypothetical protein
MLAATGGVTLDEAFRQMRVRARSSSRKLAEVAQVVVQEVQRERVAARALDDARVRAAEARAREVEQALSAAQTGLARRAAALDRAQDDLDARERAADRRERLADERGATGPLMSVTISPTPVSGRRTCATGPPRTPSSLGTEKSGGKTICRQRLNGGTDLQTLMTANIVSKRQAAAEPRSPKLRQ